MQWLLGRFIGVALCLSLATAAAAQLNQRWIDQFGTPDRDIQAFPAPDGDGGAYVAGTTQGSLGGQNFGSWDGFVARYDSAGNRTWATQFGSANNDYCGWAASDGTHGVFVAGVTWGDLAEPNAGSTDGFLASYDSDGNQRWIRQFGTSAEEDVRATTPDGAGGVYIAGSTLGSLGGPNAGGRDVYLARYDANGFPIFFKQFGTIGNESAYALSAEGAGGVYIGGDTSADLGGGGGHCWLARYDGNGKQLWIIQFGTDKPEAVLGLATDISGDVFVGGTTQGDLGGPNSGDDDVFLVRYKSTGFPVWVKQFGTSSKETVAGLAPDGLGGVFVGGYTLGSLGGA